MTTKTFRRKWWKWSYLYGFQLILVGFMITPVFSGRRYAVQDGSIQELPPISSEIDWFNVIAKEYHALAQNLSTLVHLDADHLLIRELLYEETWEDWDWLQHIVDSGPYSIAELHADSIFCIGRKGDVYERFFNGVKWVYMRHSSPDDVIHDKIMDKNNLVYIPKAEIAPIVALTSVRIPSYSSSGDLISYSGIVASDASGRLLQREPGHDGILRWIDISIPGEATRKGGISGNTGHTVFLTDHGNLYERDFWSREWTKYGAMEGFEIANVVDVFSFSSESIFAVSRSGHLLEYRTGKENKWYAHGYPFNQPLKVQAGVIIRPSKHTRSLLLLERKRAVQVTRNRTSNEFEYDLHFYPPAEMVALTDEVVPFTIVDHGNGVVIFWVSKAKDLVVATLFQEAFNGLHNQPRWVWENKAAPRNAPALMARARPIYVNRTEHDEGIVVILLENGDIAELSYSLTTHLTEWRNIVVPKNESGYCTMEKGSTESCLAA